MSMTVATTFVGIRGSGKTNTAAFLCLPHVLDQQQVLAEAVHLAEQQRASIGRDVEAVAGVLGEFQDGGDLSSWSEAEKIDRGAAGEWCEQAGRATRAANSGTTSG